MGIRLNKVLSELNIGLQTAVDFLKKKSLGEIEDDAKLSTKISDEQYEALVTEFKGDQAMKHEAEKIFIKKAKEKKQEKEEKRTTKAEELLEQRQQFKPMGKIDLDALSGKKATPAAPKQEPVEEKPEVVAVEPEPIVEEKPVEQEPEPVVVEKEEPQPVIEEQIPEPVAEETPVAQPVDQPVAKETLPSQGATEIYTLKSEEKMVPKVNVLGKIDLSTINQSTRPKKKSKEERRKEREEKAAQNGERKKRERIRSGKERVDIESAGIQANGNNGGKKGKNKGGNQPSADNQGGGKKNKKNRPVQKSLEVDEEAVARQVKETLARLTSKSQNKKGAKYPR